MKSSTTQLVDVDAWHSPPVHYVEVLPSGRTLQ